MSQPKLTPLPVHSGKSIAAMEQMDSVWLCHNRPALEAIIKQQEQTVEQHNVIKEPSSWDVRVLTKRIDELYGRINDLYGWTAKSTDARHEIERRLDALEARNLSDVHNTLENHSHSMYDILSRLKELEARQPQTPEPKPKCELCHDHRYIDVSSNKANTSMRSLCPCVKPGDVVSAEVANVLPVGSRVKMDIWDTVCSDWFWERTEYDWKNQDGRSGLSVCHCNRWTILRIGPATATTDVPDKAEEIAREIWQLDAISPSRGGSYMAFMSQASAILRKHHVGQPIPLADLLADPRLRPVVDGIKWFFENGPTSWIGSIPFEVREAIEAVK